MSESSETQAQYDIRGDQVVQSEGSDSLESVYYSSAHKVIRELNRVSPSMCLAKWYNVSMHLTTGRTHSCYHPPSHKIPLSELNQNPTALHNTSHKKKQREMMLKGERPAECSYCWKIEDANPGFSSLSDRAYRSNDVYTPELLESAQKAGGTADVNPVYVEVNFNQACNFRCSYCSPHLSSAWLKEIQAEGPYKLLDVDHNDLGGLRSSGLMPDLDISKRYVDAFWKWWPELYKTLRYFRMTGGEPLIDKNSFRVFDYVQAHPKEDLQLAITSNCCPPEEMWSKFLESLQGMEKVDAYDHFMLFCSLDSWGPQAAYIRNGMDFDRLYRNITDFLKNTRKTSLTFIVTYNNLSVVGFRRYLEGILALRREFSTDRQKVWFDTPILHDPAWMNLHTLPENYQQILADDIAFVEEHLETASTRFKGFKDFELDRLKRLHKWMCVGSEPEKVKKDRANFALFFNQIDQRRGTSYRESFPEMRDFFDLCDQSLKEMRK